MAEYIGCRDCSSPNCKGCNVYTLETMLKNGKFDCLMNGNRSVNPWADVAPVVHGEWKFEHDPINDPKKYFIRIVCSCCGLKTGQKSNYCPNCGAKMDGERKEPNV